jgi:myo-inositol-1(or 4)-monophosphatase
MRRNLRSPKRIQAATQHDLKIELDVRCQALIERTLRAAFPRTAILGEEGTVGDPEAPDRWVVDPIDGTVNFAYGIPHACVSIALQRRGGGGAGGARPRDAAPGRREETADYETTLGVVYDPFCDELWTATCRGRSRLNGRIIQVSNRRHLAETIITIGFAKRRSSLQQVLPVVNRLMHRVRKLRVMGAAALDLAYVASGRMDAYLEPGVRLWDIAAGGLILERAGGDFWREPVRGAPAHTYRIMASNGRLRAQLAPLVRLFRLPSS